MSSSSFLIYRYGKLGTLYLYYSMHINPRSMDIVPIQFASLRITAREIRSGAIIFINPKA